MQLDKQGVVYAILKSRLGGLAQCKTSPVVVLAAGGGVLAEAMMLTKSVWPLYVGSASLPFSVSPGSSKCPGSALGSVLLIGVTGQEDIGEEEAGV